MTTLLSGRPAAGGTAFIIASRNAHKLSEIRAILGEGYRYFSMADFPDAPSIEETGSTFVENARLKSQRIAEWLLHPANARRAALVSSGFVLADDSGLEVDALDGAPGVESARFASPEFHLQGNAPDGANNCKLLRKLAMIPEGARTARFRCVLSLSELVEDRRQLVFEGVFPGRIGFLPRGSHGFGYDPLFIPDGFDVTLAELGEETKNQLSHRARALEKLREWLAGTAAPIAPQDSSVG